MPGMSQVIFNNGVKQGREEGREEGKEEGREEGQNDLIMVIRRLRNGETREELLEAGTDEHTLELAESVVK